MKILTKLPKVAFLAAILIILFMIIPSTLLAKTHRPFYKNWTTTQNVITPGKVNNQSTMIEHSLIQQSLFESNADLCSNTPLQNANGDANQNGYEVPVAIAVSVNGDTGTKTTWQMVTGGSLQLINNGPAPINMHVIAYIGDPSDCTDFASCKDSMTRITGLFDGTLESVELFVPFTLSKDQIPPTSTGLMYISILFDPNGYNYNNSNGNSTVKCIASAFSSSEHNDIP